MWELLNEVPEAEAKILSMLVNKLGDPERKVGSKVVYLMSETLHKHPGMKGSCDHIGIGHAKFKNN